VTDARPFPLYAAPLEKAVERLERGRCGLCGAEDAERWELGIGADVVVACEGCGTVIAVDADTGASRCSSCGRVNALRLVDGESGACTACLRDGRAALTKDTEFGMVRWEDALRGRTHGVPADSP
jgi:hypothetical protein